MIAVLPQDLSGARDKAILLLGFAGGMRRSEIVALDLADLQLGEEGFAVQIRHSKTDQSGAGRKMGFRTAKTPSPARSKPSSRGLSWRRSRPGRSFAG